MIWELFQFLLPPIKFLRAEPNFYQNFQKFKAYFLSDSLLKSPPQNLYKISINLAVSPQKKITHIKSECFFKPCSKILFWVNAPKKFQPLPKATVPNSYCKDLNDNFWTNEPFLWHTFFTISNHLPRINSDVPAPGLSMFQSQVFCTEIAFLENFFSDQQKVLLSFNISVTVSHHLQKPPMKVLIPKLQMTISQTKFVSVQKFYTSIVSYSNN